MEFTRVFESGDARFGTAGPLLIVVYRGTANVAVLNELDRVQESMLQQHPRISTLTLISQASTALKVEEGVRARGVELGKKYETKVVGSAIVVTAKGLGAVMVRTFLSGFFLLSRAETPMKTFASVQEGLSWLQALPGQDVAIKTAIKAADVERFLA
jgi:hypothetical protein